MLEETQLIEQLKEGNQAAFKQLVESFQDRVYNTCLGLLQNAEDAEDQTQEVFITVFTSIAGFKGDSSLNTWIYRVAVNKCTDLLRKRSTQKRFAFLTSLFGDSYKEARGKSDFDHPGVALEKKENAKILFKAINGLPENQRIAFTLHKVEGLSYAEIASIMENSVSSVESLMFRAKQNLQKSLENHYKNL